VEIRLNSVNMQSRNIVFGSCIAPRRIGRILPGGSIIFNLEQIIPGNVWANQNYLAHLRGFEVWDYSVANTRSLQEAGVAAATCVPLGYVPEMTRITENIAPDTDALFYGLVSDRRHAVIQRLLAGGVGVICPSAAFGNLRDKLIAHAKIVLNIHNIVPARLEIARLGYVWANKKAVLSESCAGDEIPEDLRDACAFASCDDLPEAAARLLSDERKLRRQARTGFKAFAARPLTRTMERLVGRRARAVPGTGNKIFPPVKEWLVTGDVP
jgi:hypothetical protein